MRAFAITPRLLTSLGICMLLSLVAGCAQSSDASANDNAPAATGAKTATAIFAGGCFWCMQPPFDKLKGVLSTTSGYTGGHLANPSYAQVSGGATGHAESVKIIFDPTKIDYAQLLDVFWHNIDPVAVNRQFCDVGSQYRSAIFVLNDKQRRLAEASKNALQTSGRFNKPVATQIIDASTFYPAEEYHQNYYKKNRLRYKYYRWRCGRDQRLEQIWGESAH